MSDVATESKPDPDRGRGGGAARRVGIVVLFIIALISGFVGNVSGWGWWFLFDTKNFVAVVAPLSDDDDVSRVIAQDLVDELFTTLDLEQEISNALPDRASFLAGPITNGAENFATDAVQRLIQSDAFQTIWRDALTRGHEVALAVLRGDTDRIKITNGEVVLDFSGAADTVANALSSVGLDVVDTDDLPDDFGQIVLFEDEQLGAVQDAVSLLDTFSFWLPIVALAAWLGALALARDRRRMFVNIGVAVALSYLLQLTVLRVVRRALLNDIPDSQNRDAASTVWDEVTLTLRQQLWSIVVIGVIIAAIAYFFGPSARAVRIRTAIVERIHAARGERDPDAEPDLAERIFSPYRRAFQVAIFVLALLYLLTASTLTVATVVVVAILTLVALALVELAAGPPKRETEPTESERSETSEQSS